MHDPINKSLVVPLTPDQAFTLFTKNIDTWWPTERFSVFGEKAKITFPDHKTATSSKPARMVRLMSGAPSLPMIPACFYPSHGTRGVRLLKPLL